MAGYQVMPRMSPERYAALEEDIVANGVQEPIKVSEDGVIVDGHHRDEIARKHDLHCPRIVIKGDAAYLRDRAFVLNSARRDLTTEERRGLVEKSLRSDPILRDSDHARRTGTDPRTVKRIREAKGIPTPDDVIREAVEENPGKSSREIARELGVGKDTVRSVRGGGKPANVDFPPPEDRTPEPAPKLQAVPEPQPIEEEEPTTQPTWEEVAQIPPERLKNVAKPKAINIPQDDLDALNSPGIPLAPEPKPGEKRIFKPLDENYHNPKKHLIDLMSHLKKASKAIEDAIFTAGHIDSWDGGPISGDLRDLLDQLDSTLNGGSFDAELARLIEGEKQ